LISYVTVILKSSHLAKASIIVSFNIVQYGLNNVLLKVLA